MFCNQDQQTADDDAFDAFCYLLSMLLIGAKTTRYEMMHHKRPRISYPLRCTVYDWMCSFLSSCVVLSPR